MSPRDFLLALVVVATWGFNFVVLKVGVGQIPPLLLTALRFALVALLVAPLFRLRTGQAAGVARIALVLGVLHFGLIAAGIRGVDAATAAIVIQLQVPFSALLARLRFGEMLGPVRAAGMAVAFAGVALLAGEPSRPDPLSLLMLLGSAFAFAWAAVLIKNLGPIHPVALTGWSSLMAAPVLFVLSFVLDGGPGPVLAAADWRGWGAVVYTALASSILAHSLWYFLLRRHAMNQVVPFTLLAPVIGILSGVAVLGEPLTWEKAVGGGLTLLGVAVIQLWRPPPRRAAP
jgi:O-acetylserine/cysteine efflux transporter